MQFSLEPSKRYYTNPFFTPLHHPTVYVNFPSNQSVHKKPKLLLTSTVPLPNFKNVIMTMTNYKATDSPKKKDLNLKNKKVNLRGIKLHLQPNCQFLKYSSAETTRKYDLVITIANIETNDYFYILRCPGNDCVICQTRYL